MSSKKPVFTLVVLVVFALVLGVTWVIGKHSRPPFVSLRTLAGHAGAVTAVAFSPRGDRLASAGEDRQVRVWSLDGKCLFTLDPDVPGSDPSGKPGVTSVAFSPDGALLAVGCLMRPLKLFSMGDGKLVRSLAPNRTKSVAFLPTGELVLAPLGGPVEVWSAETGTVIRTFDGDSGGGASIALATSSTSDLPGPIGIAVGGHDNRLRQWTADGKAVGTLDLTSEPAARLEGNCDVVRSYLGGTIYAAFGSGDRLAITSGIDHLWIHSARSGSVTGSVVIPRNRRDQTATLTGVAFSPDGERLACSSYDGSIRLWGRGERRFMWRYLGTLENDGGETEVRAFAFSPDGRQIATACSDGTVRLWQEDPAR